MLARDLEAPYFVYIMASGRNCTLYTGSTNDIVRRVWQHRAKIVPGFTKTYAVDKLVWLEPHGGRANAFRRERQIKEWRRGWKIELIEAKNPSWRDLAELPEICERFPEIEAHWRSAVSPS